MFTVELRGDQQLIAKFGAMPSVVHIAVVKATDSLRLQLEAHIKNDKLQGQVLNHKTGALTNSIHSETIDQGNDVVQGRVYSANVPYAAIHEFGGFVPERFPVNAQALHFFIGGAEVFAKSAKAFTMPERSFMRSALKDFRDRIIDTYSKAVKAAAKEAIK